MIKYADNFLIINIKIEKISHLYKLYNIQDIYDE